ncbi:Putative protein of unknown function [Podospora comata]|uniref:Uncharacterized protein n=1 Tax=Podospora comata TaxID=48703 RepID=A0ABY6SEB7_PODCO|nr:Putative protein of unknown function [Podospora comata]
MPKNVFDWEPIWRHPHGGTRSRRPPPSSTLHVNRQGPHCQSSSGKEGSDSQTHSDVFKIQFGNLPVKVIIRRQFFQLTLTWLEGMLQKACETAVAGVDDYDGVPSDQDILNSEPDWEEVTGLEDWVWVEKTDVEA